MPTDLTSNPVSTRRYCGFPRRLLGMLYDSLVLLGLLFIASALALPVGAPEKVAFRDFWFTAWLFLVVFAYFAICWKKAGMTLGMRAWKVRLIDRNDAPLTWLQCLSRFLVGILSILVFFLGFAWAIWDRQNRSWHDLAAGTLLVRSD